MIKHSLGIDVSVSSLACCISSIDLQQQVQVLATRTFANLQSGFKSMIHWTKNTINKHTSPGMPAGGYQCVLRKLCVGINDSRIVCICDPSK